MIRKIVKKLGEIIVKKSGEILQDVFGFLVMLIGVLFGFGILDITNLDPNTLPFYLFICLGIIILNQNKEK